MYTPLKVLRSAVQILSNSECRYCLVGGHAASLYRTQARVTEDADFALGADVPAESRRIAEQCIKKLGFKPVIGHIPPSQQEPKRPSICLITSTPPPDSLTGIIDILLPTLPWVGDAVARAQFNKLDLGFARTPVITPEDLIVAKCYALRNSPDRFQDLDDLKEIFLGCKALDLDYLRSTLDKHSLVIPEQIQKYAPF